MVRVALPKSANFLILESLTALSVDAPMTPYDVAGLFYPLLTDFVKLKEVTGGFLVIELDP